MAQKPAAENPNTSKPMTDADGNEYSFAELSTIVERIQTELDALNAEAKEILKKTGMSKEEMEAYIENRDNFTLDEWEKIQTTKKEVDDFNKNILSALGKDPKAIEMEMKKDKEKKQKQKIKGMKKKNWIQVS